MLEGILNLRYRRAILSRLSGGRLNKPLPSNRFTHQLLIKSMFLSMGNVEASIKVGLLFVDFEIPQRIRVRGEATCLREGSILKSYPGANLVVEVLIWFSNSKCLH